MQVGSPGGSREGLQSAFLAASGSVHLELLALCSLLLRTIVGMAFGCQGDDSSELLLW